MEKPIILDTPDGIAFFALASLKGRLSLEIKGLKGRGPSAYSVAKKRYALKGSRESVLTQLTRMVEDAIAAKGTR